MAAARLQFIAIYNVDRRGPLRPGEGPQTFSHSAARPVARKANPMTDPDPSKRIPQDFAAKLKAARSARTMQGERRVVTILFCDVAGSTAMAERLDPEEWAEIMDDAFDFMIAPIFRYEGTVARLMGDSILAFFGAPIAHENDPQRAVLAGLDILADIRPFQERMARDHGLDFNLRVGLNTGAVVVGEIGSDLAVEYTAMGDAVNLAARMEQTAQPGTLQITAQTHKLVAPLFDFEPLDPIPVKGKSQPVTAYRVLGPKEQPGRLRGIQGLSAPLVGRDSEMDTLRAAIAGLGAGRGGIVALIGDAGLGKSRLIEELQNQFPPGAEGGLQWGQHQGIEYDSSRAYGLFLPYLRQAFEVQEGDGPLENQEKTARILEGVVPAEAAGASRAVELLLTLAENLEVPDLEGEGLQRELYAAFTWLWQDTARTSPTIMLVDDLHWADEASVDLLIHLLRLVETSPLLLLVAMRPHRQSPSWRVKQVAEADYPHRYTEIHLSPLSENESDTLISGLLTIAELPARLRNLILAKSDGNPFFVEEVIRTLIERGDVTQDETESRWIATRDVAAITIPDNLRALLTARIDRLDRGDRATLQVAAVIGRHFYKRVLQQIIEQQAQLEQQLSTYQRVDLIRESARIPELEYKFVHELTREAAYHSILRRERRNFHQRVAQALEALFPDRLEEEAHRLAYHYDQAGLPDPAVKYYRQAGDSAARIFANAEAIAHYSRAIELARSLELPDEALVYLYTKKGRAQELSSQHDLAIETYQELESLGEARAKPALVLAALIPQATIYSIPAALLDPVKGRTLSERSLSLARRLGDPRSEAKSNWNLMLVESSYDQDLPEALAYGLAAMQIARENHLEEELAFILHDLSRVHAGLGQYKQALETAAESGRLWRNLNNLPMLVDNLSMTATHYFETGRHEEGKALAEEALEISSRIGSIWGKGYTLNTLGLIQIERGEVFQGLLVFRESLELAEDANILLTWQAFSLAIIGWLHGYLGAPEMGLPYVERGLELSREINLAPLTYLHYLAGHEVEARAAYDEQMDMLDTLLAFPYPLPAVSMVFLGEMALAFGDSEKLRRGLDQVLEATRQRKSLLYLADMLLLDGRIHQAEGRLEDARRSMEKGLEISGGTHPRRVTWELQAALAVVEAALDNPVRAQAHRLAARENVLLILEGIEDPSLRKAFRNTPEVQRLFDSPEP